MKIKTQFIAGMVIFGAIILIIAASILNSNNQIAQFNGQAEIVRRIERGTEELSYLSNDYFLYQESQQFSRWQSKLSSISNDVESLNPVGGSEQALIGNIEADMLRLNTVFTEVVQYLENAPRNVSVRIDPEFQISWSRMAVQTQTLAFDASQLSQMLHAQADQAQQTNVVLILTLFGVFGAYFLTNYLIVYRRTLKSISDLQAGTKIIGSGNFDFTIPQKSNDEIGELTQAFNQMTDNLKRVTASKQELVKEVSERMRAEELLKVVNGELTATNEALTSANEELAAQEEELRAQTEELQVANERNEEYASKLEEMVKERTDKLRESEERLRRATLMDTVSRIGATVAHDLRGPLVTIGQAAEMAKMKPELVERMLEMIAGNTDRSLRMIEEFRNATREVHVVKQNVDLRSLVREAVEAVPKPGNISLDMRLGEELPEVSVDIEIMRRVIDNLVRNAVEAMPDGGRLTVSTRRVDGKSIIEVNDTGVGITEEAAKSLFEPLFTTKRGGMGLGLYFVRMAVEAHGGGVGFASRPGEGTTFKVTLP